MVIKTKKYIASFILLSYIALSIANVTHFHRIKIGTNLSEKYVSEFQLVQKGFNHSFFECPIINTFNNLHNLVNFQIDYSVVFLLQEQDISLIKTQSFLKYLIYSSISPRAPPALLS